jgi:superfamily I DNA/RNA helicase
MNEAQGVEFDAVFIVGIDKNTFNLSFNDGVSESLIKEKKRINRDLLYVALTRAISELHILGRAKLSQIGIFN